MSEQDVISKDTALWRQALENARVDLAAAKARRADFKNQPPGTQWADLKDAENAAQHYIWDIEIAFVRGDNYLLWKLKK